LAWNDAAVVPQAGHYRKDQRTHEKGRQRIAAAQKFSASDDQALENS